ncbi:PASTA domain-containing protein [Sandaracinobacteroides saxicola]|uniref:PASTA domain-containing protein n=1 Tax=Sandaracinobacteroides saxicola TaxID=2759707 RepID=A0A7G5IHL4_9SPHN|nr:hypothetical protein [Sandaracinobacteroides saxicola]QMW22856.1 hypothetical protein H3309_16425 [Sandaracinobacteroides saxicola]
MSTSFQWFARLLDGDAKPVSAVKVEVQLFDLAGGAWTAFGGAESDGDGRLRGKGEIADDSVAVAPAMRLVEAGTTTVLSATPGITRSARGLLNVDFGELTRLPPETHFTLARAAGRFGGRDRFTIGGVARGVTVAGGTAASDTATSETGASDSGGDDRIAAANLLAAREAVLASRERLLAERERTFTTVRGAADAASAATAPGLATAATAAALGGDGGVVGMRDLAIGLGTQLDDAQVALKSRGFSLGAVSIVARGAAVGDGTQMRFLGAEELKSATGAAISEFKVNMAPDSERAADTGLRVPDVSQLTENAARRVLASVGLVLEATYGSRALNPAAAEGQAMLQTPAAGTESSRGARVLVVFARGQG